MDQAPDSPIDVYQRKTVIAGLKQANRSEFKQHTGAILWIAVYIEIMLLMQSPMFAARFTWNKFTVYSCELLFVSTCYLVLAWILFTAVARPMYRHAALVFTRTSLVAYVLGLPTEIAAFRGWHIAWLAGEWLKRKPEPYNLCRRIKAIHARFGAWSKYFGCPPEPWAVRLAIYFAVCAPVGYVWLTTLLVPQQSSSTFVVILIGFYILFGLMCSVMQGRRAGIRSALIDYFEAEAARGEVKTAEAGASDG